MYRPLWINYYQYWKDSDVLCWYVFDVYHWRGFNYVIQTYSILAIMYICFFNCSSVFVEPCQSRLYELLIILNAVVYSAKLRFFSKKPLGNRINSILKWFGSLSLELYILHMLIYFSLIWTFPLIGDRYIILILFLLLLYWVRLYIWDGLVFQRVFYWIFNLLT